MSTNDLYLAVYIGSKTSPRMAAWMALPEAERKAKEIEGVKAWKGWVEKHHSVIVEMGGPLGKTTKIDANGATDVTNQLTGFTLVRAPSQAAAAKLFENHPHFANFPGEGVEVMPVLPIPAG
ncbi:hypothetical protein JQ596_06960 [Bradyrhizobium manausense]|uniref:YciI family protein n=1 Tax=Bradyrhizobium TaxID=374 RepID=UPI001BA76C66|nr:MULTISPECIES: YciI family protein [Bradyrhizobium]MBR0825269.1 hypothetical protein [Bradyrhizobium manausense]UVO28453.1 hypothetical protein KUF59_39370 [Bradyrhizobium arachidis]